MYHIDYICMKMLCYLEIRLHLLHQDVNHCTESYMGLALKMVQKLQLVQNAAARVLTETNLETHD